jgi:SAM-dependent methyltransferase
MFFSDPVAAFTNIRESLKPSGRLVFVCWRPLNQNPWMRAPLEAALPLLPPIPPFDPMAPGPFAFADAGRVQSILASAGFGSVKVNPFDAAIGGANLEQTLQLALNVGPLGAALRENPQCSETVANAVRDLLSKIRYAERRADACCSLDRFCPERKPLVAARWLAGQIRCRSGALNC